MQLRVVKCFEYKRKGMLCSPQRNMPSEEKWGAFRAWSTAQPKAWRQEKAPRNESGGAG